MIGAGAGAARGAADVGRGGGRNNNRGGGRGGGRNGGGPRWMSGARREVVPPFVGSTVALEGFIFDTDVSGDGADMFARTHKELGAYVGRTFTYYTAELSGAVQDLVIVMPARPANPAANADAIVEREWLADVTEQKKKLRAFEDFVAQMYNTVLGQCTKTMVDKLESLPGFGATFQNGIALLVLIRTVMNRVDADDTTIVMASVMMLGSFHALRIGMDEPLSRFYSKYKSKAESLVAMGINITPGPVLVEATGIPNAPTAVEIEAAYQKTLAAMFLVATKPRFAKYARELKNSMLEGRDYYPTTLVAAFNILQQRQDEYVPRVRGNGVAFATTGATTGTPVPGTNGQVYPTTERTGVSNNRMS